MIDLTALSFAGLDRLDTDIWIERKRRAGLAHLFDLKKGDLVDCRQLDCSVEEYELAVREAIATGHATVNGREVFVQYSLHIPRGRELPRPS